MDLEKCARSQKKEQEGQGRFGRFGRVRAVLPHTGGPDGTSRLGGSISSGSLPVSAGHSVHTPPSPEGRMVSKSVSGCRKLQWRRKSVRSTAACRTRPRRASLFIVPSYLAQRANGVLRLGAVVPSVPFWTHPELRLCTSCTCARGIRSSKRFGALSCRMRCSEFCIRARNGRLHRTCCTRYGHVPLFLADAQIARIAYGNFGSLSCRFGASQMHS